MSEGGYKITNQSAMHFMTFAVVEWANIFSRNFYSNIVVDSMKYCQREKGFVLHCWCIMSNHLHLIASARNNNLSDIMRDFKTFTSKKIITSIRNNPKEYRREWILKIFEQKGMNNTRNEKYQLWQQETHPMECYSPDFTSQKLNYIHANPVKAGIVDRPEHYRYSSARDYVNGMRCGLIDVDFI